LIAQASPAPPNSVVTPDIAHDALAPIGDDAPATRKNPAPQSAPQSPSPSAPAVNARPSVNQMLAAGEACFAHKDYSCSITNAKSVLQVQPGNTAAVRLKSRAEAAQADALNNIKIE
jgi:hypothetical protein